MIFNITCPCYFGGDKMGNLIVKDNALIEASHKLSESEQRLVLLAILKGREFCDSIEELKDKELIIHAEDYMKAFGVERQSAYESLKKAVSESYDAGAVVPTKPLANHQGRPKHVKSVQQCDDDRVVLLLCLGHSTNSRSD